MQRCEFSCEVTHGGTSQLFNFNDPSRQIKSVSLSEVETKAEATCSPTREVEGSTEPVPTTTDSSSIGVETKAETTHSPTIEIEQRTEPGPTPTESSSNGVETKVVTTQSPTREKGKTTKPGPTTTESSSNGAPYIAAAVVLVILFIVVGSVITWRMKKDGPKYNQDREERRQSGSDRYRNPGVQRRNREDIQTGGQSQNGIRQARYQETE
ncbi:PREDICTED: flocculation protein FLO11-like [Cyprinodon variegatus]|uniref:flocculation protein FLO11-like n=1 Tax=Cyprinodon variegatus TaxID=28743 RepID=UPI000742CA6C|nr:PREDICTED: flocculation protein FLO11-like [Cyprinodon variegatus]